MDLPSWLGLIIAGAGTFTGSFYAARRGSRSVTEPISRQLGTPSNGDPTLRGLVERIAGTTDRTDERMVRVERRLDEQDERMDCLEDAWQTRGKERR